MFSGTSPSYANQLNMAFASDLLKVRLKSTDEGAKRDRSSPNIQLVSKDNKEREETRRKEFFDGGFDRWYELLKDKTIPSQIVEIKPAEANAIVLCWKRDFQRKESDSAVLSEAHIQLPADLHNLIDRLSSTIASFPERVHLLSFPPDHPKILQLHLRRLIEHTRLVSILLVKIPR